MDRIFVIDVGNTNMALGVYEGAKLKVHARISTMRDRTADELGMLLYAMMQQRGVHPRELDGIVISSVVPPIMASLEDTCRYVFGRKPLIVGPGIRTGLQIRYENPRDVGADRIANAVGAIALYGPPLIVVDLGTATTFTVVDEEGQYVGGVIAPGIKISTEALFHSAAKLPRIELVRPKHVIGRSTVTSMQSGVVYGFVGQVDEIVRRIKQELPLPYKVVATGGLADLVRQDSTTIQIVNPFLTLEGLRCLWERNK